MKCTRCQQDNPLQARFCMMCGGIIILACARCGTELPSGVALCVSCGHPIGSAAAGNARLTPAGTHIPKHLAEKILTSKGALEGERKQVTVLFADITASMAVLTSHDAEEAAVLFDRVLEYLVEAVRRYEGTVTQVLGDGILALFGAPISHEDHALRACYAALRMQERIREYGDAVQRAHGIPIQIRVGLNSGEVVVRAIGAEPDALSAVGQTVHVAARMEQLAKPGTVLATTETVVLGAGRVRTRTLGPVNVKGLPDPIEVFEVIGALSSSSSAAPLARPLTPLVGRQAELRQLTATLDVVRQGMGQLVAVTGEPGIGKTRIVQEFLGVCRARGCLTFGAAAQPFTRATGHRTGLDVIRSYFGLDRSDAPQIVREKVDAAMRAVDPELAECVPAMLYQLGVLEDSHPSWRLDAATRRQRAFEANFRLIGAEARRQPFVLVLEDLQWIDSDAEDSLKLFAKGLAPFTLVVVTYRPEYEEAWLLRAGGVRLHLEPLGPATAANLLDALLGAAPELASLKGLLIDRAGGNPLFLEESVRDLAQSGALSGDRGQHRLERPVTAIHIPSTVRSVLEARIDRLPPEDKRVLQCAAVLGEHVPSGLLEGVTDLPADDMLASLARLRQAEFLEEQGFFPEPVYGFRHSLTHDVAYGSLLHDRRRGLHARALAALEGRHAAAPAEIVEALAHHALRAELWEQAVRYSRQAGARTNAGRAAVAFFEQALDALRHLPDDAAHRALAVDVRDELSRVLMPLGEHPRIVVMLREAQALAAVIQDQARLARTLALLSFAYWEVGDSMGAIEMGERAVAVAELVDEPDLRVMANFSLGGAARAIGDYRRAVSLLRANLLLTNGARAAEHFGLPGAASVLTRGHLAWSLAELGEFPEAVAQADEAIRLAQTAAHAFSQAHAQLALGGTLLRQGRLAEAITVLERGLALTKDAPFLFAPTAGDLGIIYVLSGRAEAGIELAERAVAQAEGMGRLGRLSLIVTHLGEAYFFAGRRADAGRQAERALALAVERGECGNQVYAHRLLGLVAAEAEPPLVEVARHHLGMALALAGTLGMRPLAARCHLALGHLARRLGDMAVARPHLDAACALLEAMQMRYWLDRLALNRIGPE